MRGNERRGDDDNIGVLMKSYARLFLAFACLVISVAALFNVFSDNDDVRAKAKDVG